MMAARVNARAFYAPYHGHDVAHLDAVRRLLAAGGARRFIYLAGDSSLDNKFWLSAEPRVASAGGMERALSPPCSPVPPDVAAAGAGRLAGARVVTWRRARRFCRRK